MKKQESLGGKYNHSESVLNLRIVRRFKPQRGVETSDKNMAFQIIAHFFGQRSMEGEMKAVVTCTGKKDVAVANIVSEALTKQNAAIEQGFRYEENGSLKWVYVANLSEAKLNFVELQKQMKALSKELFTDIRVQRADLFEETSHIQYPARTLNL